MGMIIVSFNDISSVLLYTKLEEAWIRVGIIVITQREIPPAFHATCIFIMIIVLTNSFYIHQILQITKMVLIYFTI